MRRRKFRACFNCSYYCVQYWGGKPQPWCNPQIPLILKRNGWLDRKRHIAQWSTQLRGYFEQCFILLWAAVSGKMTGSCNTGGCDMFSFMTLCLPEPSPSVATSMPRYLSQSLDGHMRFPWIRREIHMRFSPCCFNGMECLPRKLLMVRRIRLWAILSVKICRGWLSLKASGTGIPAENGWWGRHSWTKNRVRQKYDQIEVT